MPRPGAREQLALLSSVHVACLGFYIRDPGYAMTTAENGCDDPTVIKYWHMGAGY